MADPQRGVAYDLVVSLNDIITGAIVTDPSISSGDFRVSIDGGAFADLASTPAVSPSGSPAVALSLTATEMNGDNIVIWAVDQAEVWDDVFIAIQTAETTLDTVVDGYTFAELMAGIAAATMGEDAAYASDVSAEYQAVDGSKTRVSSDLYRQNVTLDLD